jgi:glycosyltransferase involved in cell wall biosynthesis
LSRSTEPRLLVATTIPATFTAFLVPFARHQREHGWRVDLATGAGELPSDAAGAVDARIDVPWSRSLRDPSNVTAAVRRARAALLAGEYDLVHTHTPIASFVLRAAIASLPRRRRPKVVYTAHGFHFAPGRARVANAAFTAAEWIAGRVTDRLVVINDHDERAATQRRLVARDRLVRMHGIGVDLGWYRRTPALEHDGMQLRRSLGIPGDAEVLTVVAELTVRKQQHLAIEALARVDRTDVHLVLAGGGPLRDVYEQCAVDHGVADRVHFLGDVRDVRPLMVASTATMLPSFREGLSRSVLESLALGVPVLGSDIRGIADVVAPDGGILFAPGDSGSLAGAIERLLHAPRIDELTRARVRERLRPYGLDELVVAHDRLYRSLVPVPAGAHAGADSLPIEQEG